MLEPDGAVAPGDDDSLKWNGDAVDRAAVARRHTDRVGGDPGLSVVLDGIELDVRPARRRGDGDDSLLDGDAVAQVGGAVVPAAWWLGTSVRRRRSLLRSCCQAIWSEPTPLLPEELEKAVRDLPRDREVIELFNKLSGAAPLPPQS